MKIASQETVTGLSLWTQSVSEPVKTPKLHLLALVVYVAGMIGYMVIASIGWSNTERPVVFEAQETHYHAAVPLNFTIDCQDCRRFVQRNPEGWLWKLSWDYSRVPGGCAARSPSLFDERLRDFCRAQNSDPNNTVRGYYPVPFAGCTNGPSLLLPWSFPPNLIPFGVTADAAACAAKCDERAAFGCVGFSYFMGSLTDPFTGNLLPANSCLLHSSQACKWANPSDTALDGKPVHTYLLKLPPAPPTNPLADPLDKCSITSNDIAVFQQSASPDPLAAATSSIPQRSGYGWNPNYIGPRPQPDYFNCSKASACWRFGPATPDRGKGAQYTLSHEIPLCYVSDDNTNTNDGLQLEISSIPHHAMAMNGARIGQAMVTIASGQTFKQINRFQPWHKNTLHLGLTVHRDENEVITSTEPWFHNFQYDGRTDFGNEVAMVLHGAAEYQQMIRLLLGPTYSGLSFQSALAIDMALKTGFISEAEAFNMTEAKIPSLIDQVGGIREVEKFQAEYVWRQAASTALTTGADGPVYYNNGRRLDGTTGGTTSTAPGQITCHTEKECIKKLLHMSPAAERWVDAAEERLDATIDVAAEGLATMGEASQDELALLTPGAPTASDGHGRRLNDHDEWGGVEYGIKLSRFANVYTLGHKPTVFDVIAQIGGASGSLIGSIGIGLVALTTAAQLLKLLQRCGKKGSGSV